jgi:hypothetical protein
MTTITISDEGADHESGALDRFKGIGALLPQLAQPWWYRHVHSGRWTPQHERRAQDTSPAAEKAKRRETLKRSRLERALAGEHTRARAATA